MGVKEENVTLCDSRGVVYRGRKEGMNKWKERHAVDTSARTLKEAIKGADVFLGLSVKGAVDKEMIKSMADKPIIFAMANPDPEILPEDILSVRDDAIIATGRSDYKNQVNNVMGFPYIFRGALDVEASTINEEMKIAAAKALANLARQDVPDEVSEAYDGANMKYGPDYIIPVPFDPRLIATVPVAVAKAAMKTGVAGKEIEDLDEYKKQLELRLDPTANTLDLFYKRLAKNPKRMIFAEGEEPQALRAAISWKNNNFGVPILVGREKRIMETAAAMGVDDQFDGVEITNAVTNKNVEKYVDHLYQKNQRLGMLKRDCVRYVKNDRNIFSACMLSCNDGDAMVTGLTRSYFISLEEVMKVIEPVKDTTLFAYSIVVKRGKTIFIADTTVNELPTSEQLAEITMKTAEKVKKMGVEPRAALMSFSTFGNPMFEKAKRIQDAVKILDKIKPDFEYDGEMSADVALNKKIRDLYPFCKLTGSANILVMPALHSANIASKLLQEFSSGMLIGPILTGLKKPVQIAQLGASVSDILNLAVIAANEAIDSDNN